MRSIPFHAVLVLLAALPAAASDLPTITVRGTATTEAMPDAMVWRLSVQDRGEDLARVAEAHRGTVGRVLDLVRAAGVEEDALQTTRMRFGENRVHRRGTTVTEGFLAATDITFTSTDLDAYADLWGKLAAVDGVEVQGVGYDVSDRIARQDATRAEALRAARRKAADMAAVLDCGLGAPVSVVEEGGGTPRLPSPVNSVALEDGVGGGTAQAPGRITIRASVSAVFRLVTPQE